MKDGAVFFSVQDSGVVLEFRTQILKVTRLLDEKGEPAFAPDGMPNYFVQTHTAIAVLSKEEWAVRKQTMEGE